MTGSTAAFAIDRILLALDAGSPGTEAVTAAAEMAARLGVDLAALFIEDSALFRVAAMPIASHISAFDRAVGTIDAPALEGELRAVAARIRIAASAAASRLRLNWTFRTVRGDPAAALTAEAGPHDLLVIATTAILPGIELTLRSRLGAAARRSTQSMLVLPPRPSLRRPLVVTTAISEEGHRTLAAAARLAQALAGGLDILAPTGNKEDASRLEQWAAACLSPFGLVPRLKLGAGGHPHDVVAAAGAIGADFVVLSSSLPLLEEEDGEDILVRSGRPVLLVR